MARRQQQDEAVKATETAATDMAQPAGETSSPGKAGTDEAVKATETAATAAPATPPADAHAPDPVELLELEAADLVPMNSGLSTPGPRAIDLLLEACERYGIDPRHETRPRELLSWNFYPGSRVEGTADAVVLVTAGGQKLRYIADPAQPMDADTEDRLRRIFGAFARDPKTKVIVPVALPDDLTLPREAVTGQVASSAHVYRGGYLRAGGRAEADRRDAQRRQAPRR